MLSAYPLAEIWSHASHDVHPPLYFMLLHGWMAMFGDSLASIRSLSVLPGIVTVMLGMWLVRLVATQRAALLAGLLLVSAGSLIYLDRVYVSISKEATRTRMAANIASEWRHLTEQSVDRSIVAAISSEENLVEQQRKLMTDGIAHITELQKKLNELVTDDESRKVLDEVAERRRKTLESNAAVQAARNPSAPAV